MLRCVFAAVLAVSCTSVVAAQDAAPAVFAPGVLSGPLHDSAPAFTPDGRTVYFTRSDGQNSTILVSHLDNGHWSTPATAAFSGQWSDMEPAMSPDGHFLVFVSNRPKTQGGKPLDGFFMGRSFPGHGGNLWKVSWQNGKWSEPVRLPDSVNRSDSTFAPAVAGNGSLYFMHPAADPKHFQLFRAAAHRGGYDEPQPLPFSDGHVTDVDPAVAPDESFAVFGSSRSPARQIDLFIVFRDHGEWGVPIHLGNGVNSAGSDAEARLSPDHQTLYFASDRMAPIAPGTVRADWDNGKYNIWQIPLEPWLEAHDRAAR